MNELQKALFRANPKLSRFDPLSRVLYFDDFDTGYNGWTALIGNYEADIDRMHPGYRQITSPMISNLSFWDSGTHGSFDGSYALKVSSRAKKGAQNVALKRITYIKPCPIQIEFFFTYKPEANEASLMETSVRSIGMLLDLQNDEHRVMPHLRYLNALNGERVEHWQYKEKSVPFGKFSDKTVTHYHLEDRDWLNLSDKPQQLCYNEIPTKVNWQYARLKFDLASMRFLEFQCNDIMYDVSNIGSMEMPAMPNLRGMLNVCLFVESDEDRRSDFYVDSVLVSGEWE